MPDIKPKCDCSQRHYNDGHHWKTCAIFSKPAPRPEDQPEQHPWKKLGVYDNMDLSYTEQLWCPLCGAVACRHTPWGGTATIEDMRLPDLAKETRP